MEEKIKKDKYNVLTIGIVGHCEIDRLASFKNIIENFAGFNVVFFKSSSGRLWIQEGVQESQGGRFFDY